MEITIQWKNFWCSINRSHLFCPLSPWTLSQLSGLRPTTSKPYNSLENKIFANAVIAKTVISLKQSVNPYAFVALPENKLFPVVRSPTDNCTELIPIGQKIIQYLQQLFTFLHKLFTFIHKPFTLLHKIFTLLHKLFTLFNSKFTFLHKLFTLLHT